MPLHTGVLSQRIDETGTAFVTITIRGPLGDKEVACVIDTGCSIGLVLHRTLADELGLPRLGFGFVILGDGKSVDLPVSEAKVECDGQPLGVDVYIVEPSEDGDGAVQPLLEVALLAGHELTINYRTSTVRIT